MSERTVRTACPLNCWDTCAILARVEDGRVTRLTGDPAHEVTRGFLCAKAARQLQRMYSRERLTHPLVKEGSGWRRVGWEEALDRIAGVLARVRDTEGTLGVLHYSDYGSMGVLKSLAHRFFNLYGGVTEPAGSLCWAAGIEAQRLDFGACLAHDPVDLVNSRTVVIWGRNPVYTNPHLLPFLAEARRQGAYVVVVDPIRTATARLADAHISPRPGTDAFLALGVAHILLDRGLEDGAFIAAHTSGFDGYRSLVERFDPDRVWRITGVPPGELEEFAVRYAAGGPATILLGYGMQRYRGGGTAVRAVDALGALAGHLGVTGGGVNYASSFVANSLADLTGRQFRLRVRRLSKPRLAEEMMEAADPPIRCLFVTRANPVAQLPHTGRVAEAFARVEFKVVVDMMLTDTALAADVVLPCATFLEEEDLFCNSWHNYLTCGEAAVAPPEGVRTELELFAELARRLGFGERLDPRPGVWIARAVKPLEKWGVTAADLKGRSWRHPGAPIVPWIDRKFATPSGRMELLTSLPDAVEETGGEGGGPEPESVCLPLRLISPQHKLSLHTQFYTDWAGRGLPTAHLHPSAAAARDIRAGDEVRLVSPRGELTCRAFLDEGVHPEAVLVYAGGQFRDGAGVNVLTADIETDLGTGAAYYDSRCEVKRVG